MGERYHCVAKQHLSHHDFALSFSNPPNNVHFIEILICKNIECGLKRHCHLGEAFRGKADFLWDVS